MYKIKKSVIVASVLYSMSSMASIVEVDTIKVVSSTINDELVDNKSESSSTTVITTKDIEKINPKSVADILNNVPGITYTLVGTDAIKIHIRGIDNQMYMGERPGVAIVIDGVPVQETSGKINVDLDNIESIKVIKGGASYLYGNDAIAGAVIITTKNSKAKNESKIETEAGSYNTKRLSFETSQAFDNSNLQLQGSFRDTDGYWDDAFVTTKSVNGKYQYYIDDFSDVTLGIDYTKRETGDGNSVSGITEAIINPTSAGYYSYSGYYKTDLLKSFLTYSKVFEDDSELMLRLHMYEDDKNYKTSRYSTDKFELWSQNGAKGEYKKSIGDIAVLTGFDIQRNSTDEKSFDVIDGNAPRGGSDGDLLATYDTNEDINALYTEIQYQANKDLVTTLNFRYDDIQLEYKDKQDSLNDVSPDYNTLSYRAGVNYTISKNLNLYSNISTGFRTPTVTQVSSNNSGLAQDPTLDIPSDIDVETTYNYEIGIRGKNGIINYDASIFQIDRKDYIGRIAGSYITSDDDEESYYDNVGDMRSRGFELAISSDANKPISFNLAYTYLQSKFTNYWISQQQTEDTDPSYSVNNAIFERVDLSGNYVSRTPNHTINLTMDYKATNEWTISPEMHYRGSYYADEANQFKQGGYTVYNLRTNYKANKSLEFFARIDNLTNKKYFEFVNVNSSALATMEDATIRVATPRAYYAGLRYRF